MSAELMSPQIVSLLTELQATLLDFRAELTAARSELHAKPVGPSKPRESFSVEEVGTAL